MVCDTVMHECLYTLQHCEVQDCYFPPFFRPKLRRSLTHADRIQTVCIGPLRPPSTAAQYNQEILRKKLCFCVTYILLHIVCMHTYTRKVEEDVLTKRLHVPHKPYRCVWRWGDSPRMTCTAAATGWAELRIEWERVLVCPQGTIPSRRVGWTGMNLARLRLTPALYCAWNRRPLSSSLKRPSPPTPTILGRRRGGGRGGREGGCEWEAEKGRKEGREGMGRGEGHNPYVEHLHRVKLHTYKLTNLLLQHSAGQHFPEYSDTSSFCWCTYKYGR